MSEFFVLGALISGLILVGGAIVVAAMMNKHKIIFPVGLLFLHAIITASIFISFVAVDGGTDIATQQQADISVVLQQLYGISLILLFPHFVFHIVHILIMVIKGLSAKKKRRNDLVEDDDFLRRPM